MTASLIKQTFLFKRQKGKKKAGEKEVAVSYSRSLPALLWEDLYSIFKKPREASCGINPVRFLVGRNNFPPERLHVFSASGMSAAGFTHLRQI